MTEITKGNQLVCLYTHTKICERRNGIQAFSQYWLMWIWEKIKWDRNWHPHKAGVHSLRELTPDGLRWGPQPPGSDAWCSECSWCNKSRNQVHGKCHVLESPWNLSLTLPGVWKNCLPPNWSLVPKKAGKRHYKEGTQTDRNGQGTQGTNYQKTECTAAIIKWLMLNLQVTKGICIQAMTCCFLQQISNKTK